jgi:hypothetical protein
VLSSTNFNTMVKIDSRYIINSYNYLSMSFYSIPIPEPSSVMPFQQLAQFKSPDGSIYEAYWLPKTRQVLFMEDVDDWHIQPDGLITKSLATLFNCHSQNIVANDITIYEPRDKHKPADAEETVAFYDCSWSDYACDKIYIQFNVTVDYECTTNVQRLLKVMRGIVDEEYADMPGLIPIDSVDIPRSCSRSCSCSE